MHFASVLLQLRQPFHKDFPFAVDTAGRRASHGGWPILKRTLSAFKPACDPERVCDSRWCNARVHHRLAESHHILQSGLHRGERLRKRRTHRPDAQHRASPRHAARGFSRHVGDASKRVHLVCTGEEPAKERGPLLGHGQRHAHHRERPTCGLHVGAHHAHAAAD